MSHRPKIITGQGPLITPKMMPPGGEECVELLEGMLESAKKGQMTWLVVVAGGPNDYGFTMVGNNGAQMNLGLDMAKDDIKARIKAR